MKSDAVKKGMQQAPHRSLFNALGFTQEEMEKPLLCSVLLRPRLMCVVQQLDLWSHSSGHQLLHSFSEGTGKANGSALLDAGGKRDGVGSLGSSPLSAYSG